MDENISSIKLLNLFQEFEAQLSDSNKYLHNALSTSLNNIAAKISPVNIGNMKINTEDIKVIDDKTSELLEDMHKSIESIDESTDKKRRVAGVDIDDDKTSPKGIIDALEEAADDLLDGSTTLGYKLVGAISGVFTGLSFDRFLDDATDFFDGVNESYRDIAQKLSLTPEEVNKVRDDIVEIYKVSLAQYKGMISQNDLLDSYRDVMDAFNLTNTEETGKIAASLTELKLATGEDVKASQVAPIYNVLKANNLDVSTASDTFNDMVRLSSRYGASYEDMLDSLSAIDGVLTQNSIDEASYRKNMYSALKSSAVLKSSGLDIDDKLFNDYIEAFSNRFNFQDQKKYQLIGIDSDATTEKIRSGDIGGARADLIEAVQNLYRTSDRDMLDWYVNVTGISHNEMAKISQLTPEDIQELRSIDRDTNLNQTDALEKAINDVPKTSTIEKLANELSFTKGFNIISDAIDNLHNSTFGSSILDIGKNILSTLVTFKLMGVGSKAFTGLARGAGLFSKVKDIAVSAGVGKAASTAATMAKAEASTLGKGILSKGSGLFSKLGGLLKGGASTLSAGGLAATGTSLLTTASSATPIASAIAHGVSSGVSSISNLIRGENKEAVKDAGSGLGGIGATLAGAKAGATIGALGGPVGIALGTIIGSVGGGLAGSKLGSKIGSGVANLFGIKNKSETLEVSKDIKSTDSKSNTLPKSSIQISSQLSSNLTQMSDYIVQYFNKNRYLLEKPLGIFSRLTEVGFINLIRGGVGLERVNSNLTEAINYSTSAFNTNNSNWSNSISTTNSNSLPASSLIPDDILGTVSAKYETSGWDPGMISSGSGDYGGKSYGVSQFTSAGGGSSANQFVDWLKTTSPELGKYFDGVGKAGSDSFDNAWKAAANANRDEFGRMQQAYTYQNYVSPFVTKVKDIYGVDMNRSKALQELAYSTSVQFGPNELGLKALGNINSSMSDEDIIKTSFKIKRDDVGSFFKSSSTEIQDSLRDNRFTTEEQDILALVGQKAVSFVDPNKSQELDSSDKIKNVEGSIIRLAETNTPINPNPETVESSQSTMLKAFESAGFDKVVAAIYDSQSRNEKFLSKQNANNQPQQDNSINNNQTNIDLRRTRAQTSRDILTPVDRMTSIIANWMDEGKQVI